MSAIDKYIEKITRLNFENQAFHNRYYARLGVSIQTEIFKRHRKIIHMLNQKVQQDIPIHIISYIAFILSIKSYRALDQKIAKKSFDELTLDQIQRLSIAKINKYKSKKNRKLTKRSQLIGISSDLATALKNGLSYRDLSHYILKEHGISAKKSTIYSVCKELNINKKENQ